MDIASEQRITALTYDEDVGCFVIDHEDGNFMVVSPNDGDLTGFIGGINGVLTGEKMKGWSVEPIEGDEQKREGLVVRFNWSSGSSGEWLIGYPNDLAAARQWVERVNGIYLKFKVQGEQADG